LAPWYLPGQEGGFTQGDLSSHLAKLEEAGYAEIEKKFKGKLPLIRRARSPTRAPIRHTDCQSAAD
jgi:DNA-binding transcriptional ArsR family regulator